MQEYRLHIKLIMYKVMVENKIYGSYTSLLILFILSPIGQRMKVCWTLDPTAIDEKC